MDEFLKNYLIAALWSSSDSDENPLDENYEISDISDESLKQAQVDCELFKLKAGEILNKYDIPHCGHDFWLTRNGHGTGFWDSGYEKNDGQILTALSKEFSNVDIYVGDDNKLYFA